MNASHPSTAESNVERHRFRLGKWLIVCGLLLPCGFGIAYWSTGFPLEWPWNYDIKRYRELYSAIRADPQHLRGKTLDEVYRKLKLENVPWDDITFQRMNGSDLMYHFRGFTLRLVVAPQLPDPDWRTQRSQPSQIQMPKGDLRLYQEPFFHIDGISDSQERMQQHWKREDEECNRINEMSRREREAKSKSR